jgi:hypothetical protein
VIYKCKTIKFRSLNFPVFDTKKTKNWAISHMAGKSPSSSSHVDDPIGSPLKVPLKKKRKRRFFR